jgi:hypothetical protein
VTGSEIQARMQPGAWSEEGFLTPGASLDDVLREDRELLDRLGTEPGTIAQRLGELLAAGGRSDWARPEQVNDHAVEILRVRGFVTCPWAPEQFEACPGGYGGRPTANRFRLTNVRTGQVLEGAELTVHMIGAHGFHGGPGTTFRIDPEAAVRFLNLSR